MPQFFLMIDSKKWLFVICIFLLNTLISDAVAIESSSDPCATFVTSKNKRDYRKCIGLIREAHDSNSSFNLNWLKNPNLQNKFTHHVASGELLFMKLAFKIIPFLDGELAEIDLMSLGQSITASPNIFLNELQRHYDDVASRDALDGLVGNVGPEYSDWFVKRVRILKKRRAAIRSVKDPELQNIRKIVINELNQQIKKIERSLKAEMS
ncbi:MAG TPA: hypothetical protein DCO77_07185 [Nitrospiraceae bacterium]|nr:hypothetical protein [Nitrospiraceae bacterium]